MKLDEFLKSKGYDLTDKQLIKPYQDMWLQWYKGNVPKFQNYTIYNGNKTIKCKRYTLNTAKKIAEDIANVILNERVVYHIGNEKTQNEINNILDANDFYVMANQQMEKMCALGEVAFVLSLGDLLYDKEAGIISTAEAKLKIDYLTCDKIYPLSNDGTKITECAFATYKKINNVQICVLSIHHKDENGFYVIDNYTFEVDKSGNLTDITDKMEETLQHLETGSEHPWFVIVKTPVANNIDLDSMEGISTFANSIDVLKGIDIIYDSFVNEFILGKKRIFVTGDLLQADTSTGEVKLTFDTNDVIFHIMPGDSTEGNKIQEVDMDIRIDEHKEGIQTILNLLSSKIGLGENRYEFNKAGLTTATQVISENSEMYRTIKKYELQVENAFVDLFTSICYIAKTFLGMTVEEEPEITIDFDDSIIEDKAETKRQAMLEYNAGLIDRIQYFVITREMTREQAVKFMETMDLPEEEEQEEEPTKE